MTRAAMLGVSMAVLVTVLGCSGPSTDERFTVIGPPQDEFPPVGDMFVGRCGSLDCHGTAGRNMRVYGTNGLRLPDPSGPTLFTAPTSLQEYNQTYLSIVTLEPEVLATVLAEHGAQPERWTVLRKGRGLEAHKGDVAMDTEESYVCLTSWLAGAVAVDACVASAELEAPVPP